MTEWGEQWAPNQKGVRIKLIERRRASPWPESAYDPLKDTTSGPQEIINVAGPGADKKIRDFVTIRITAGIDWAGTIDERVKHAFTCRRS
jgi:hypothetical protein